MPLRDHFRPPLADQRDWHSFHNNWAGRIAADLNARLPPDYFAEATAKYEIEIDVAVSEVSGENPAPLGDPPWTPPAAVATVPFTVATDQVGVEVYRYFGGKILAGAVELVSPANKDRPDTRDAFAAKCLTQLNHGVGLLIVDVVTDRHANLHDELMTRVPAAADPPWGVPLYAAAFRPTGKNGDGRLDIWREELAVGRELPTMPLWLLGGQCFAIPLEATYQTACREVRIPPNGTH